MVGALRRYFVELSLPGRAGVETPPFRSDGEGSDQSDSCIGGGGQRRAAHAGKTVD